MYGQTNYAQGSRTPMPLSQQPSPVPPPPPFQEGALASQPSMQGRPSIPPHVGQPGPPAYQHVPPAPVHQGPPVQVMPSGMLSAGQSYLSSTPPPPAPLQVHGSTSMTNSYPIARQNSLWHQNVRHVSPPVLPPLGQRPTGPNRPEVFRPPPPARVLGSLPSPGQTLCRAPVHPAQPGGVQVLQHIPPPPPRPPLPPTSTLFTPAPYGSFLHSAHQDSHMPAVVPPQPPPLPSSPPPLPPTPPPPSSPPPGSLCSTPVLTAAELPHHPESCPSSSAHFGFEVTTSGSVDEVSVPGHIRDDTTTHNDSTNPEGGSSSEVGSITKDELDPSSPPPKPAEEKIIRKIEVLCQFIANNGPRFEEMVRLKESGNPEFIFLVGGESGSEAAVAHKYFLWMKKKYSLNSKFFRGHEKVDSPSRASDIDSSKQPNSSMDLCVSHSPSDSDMDMEDDITRTDEEQQHNNSVDGLNPDSALILSKPDLKDQLHSAPTLQNASENSQCKDAASEHIRHCGSSRAAEEGKVSTLVADHDCSTFDQSFSKADGPVTTLAGAVECTSNSNVERYSNFFHENLGQTNASVVVGCSSEKFPNELNKGASPFRLLQDYASDNSSENDDEPYIQDSGPVAGSPSSPAGGRSLHGNMVSNFRTDMGSKSLSISETGTRTSFDLDDVACPLRMPSKALELSRESQGTSEGTDMTSIVIRKVEEPVEMIYGNKECIKNAASQEVSPQKDASEGSIDAAPRSWKSEKEDVKYASTPLKVDEFGRLVREGASDSDSDDSRYTGKRVKRDRSWSRSRSPYDRRRRRRSPRRKKERSRSRSWSPKKRRSRSRSRSPTLRRVGEFGGNKTRRDKVHLPDCFDFLRGRCYRGASCRYLHNDPVKNDGSRHHRNKHQQVEFPPSSRSTDFHKEIERIPLKRSVHEPDEVKSKEMQLHHDMPVRGFSGSEDYIDGGKEIVSIQPIISDQGSKSLVTDMAESERSRAQVMDTQAVKDEFVEPLTHTPDHENCPDRLKTLQPVDRIPACLVTYGRVPKSPGDNSHVVTSSTENTAIIHSQGNLSLMLCNADHQPQKIDEPSGSNSTPIQTSTSYPNQFPINETYPGKIFSIQSYPETSSMSRPILCEGFPSQSKPSELTPPTFPSMAFPHHSSQFLRSIPSLSLGTKTSLAPHMPGDYNLMPPTAKFPSHSAPVENYPSHQASLPSQHPHFSMPPNSSWTTLPPPPRPPYVIDSTANATTGMPGVPSLCQHNQLPPMNDFSSHTPVRPYSSELTTYSQSGEFPHQTHQPPFHMEDFKPKSIPTGNEANQPFGGLGPGEDRFTQSVHGLIPSSSFSHGSIPPTQFVSFNSEEASRRIKSFPGENLHPGELATSSQNHPYLQQQQPLYDLQRSTADTASVRPSDSGSTMSRYTSDPLDQNHTSHLSDFSGSRISNHYNPYASTFDQPLSSKFSSSVLRQINNIPYGNKHDTSFIFSHAPGDYQGVGSLGSRHMTSSPTSARAVEHMLPRLGGDKYDPLFDSIELSSDPIKKFDCDQKHELAKNSDITSRLSDSCKPLDLEENSKRKHVEAVAVITSLECENDEYGETADAEVGAVENGSPSNSLDVADAAAGEIEIDQVKMPGKSKKSKDSKSMKLFKIALADFVKEVLKPSWRQGNMSKEAFKTIVKKTVDKVSGAMKSHQIPKSQAKINHYIDSSQRKLTKLVMGYVDKYVKV